MSYELQTYNTKNGTITRNFGKQMATQSKCMKPTSLRRDANVTYQCRFVWKLPTQRKQQQQKAFGVYRNRISLPRLFDFVSVQNSVYSANTGRRDKAILLS